MEIDPVSDLDLDFLHKRVQVMFSNPDKCLDYTKTGIVLHRSLNRSTFNRVLSNRHCLIPCTLQYSHHSYSPQCAPSLMRLLSTHVSEVSSSSQSPQPTVGRRPLLPFRILVTYYTLVASNSPPTGPVSPP